MFKLISFIRKNVEDWYCSNCGRSYTTNHGKCPNCGGNLSWIN
jgi:hypothetical protein